MRRQAGFTLIELLVSLTLLGLLFVLLLGGLRFGARAWERSTVTADASDTVRLVQDMLRSEVERACPRRLASSAHPQDPPRLDFAGAAGQLRFLAPAPRAAGGRFCVAMALQVRPDGTLWRLALVLPSGVNVSSTDLLRGAQTIDFAYLPGNGAWQSGWQAQSQLPSLVRLRVTFPPGDPRVWPELFMAPRISAEADCTYDPATKSCRGN